MNLLKLWFSIFVVGLVFYPLTSSIFKRFNDKGWIFSKIIGIAVTSWTVWFLSYMKILEYTQANSYIVIFIYAIANLGILIFKNRNNLKDIKQGKETIKTCFKKIDLKLVKNILIMELIFILCFAFWGYIKGFNQEINNSTEQFMDYGFMNATMNTKNMPPEDIWYSGESINYYYFGQYISGFMCKISSLTASEGYNCIIVFIFACSFVLPFSIGYNLFNHKFDNKNKKLGKLLPIIVATFIAISASLGGSLHYPIYKWFSPEKDKYSYTQETRYIGIEKDSKDKTATEVPAYSSLVGDLHAHYIDLFLTLTCVALLSQYFLDERKDKYKKISFYALVFLLGLFLGIQKMSNFWDFPIYIVIISLVIIIKDLICGKFSKDKLLTTILVLVGILFIEELITLPFTKDLIISSTKVLFTGICSPFYKMLIKWGIPGLCIISFFVIFFVKFKKSKEKFKEYLNNNLSDLFIIIIGICALGLVIMPEIVYLKDIYGDDYKRFNTVFKLTYQAYILFSISTSYILCKLMISKNKYISYISLIILFIYITTFGYGVNAIFEVTKNRQSSEINAENTEKYIKNTLPDDYEAIKWIRENIDRESVILESTKYGNSYTTSARISSFTGNPTVLGWSSHEWLWRCDKDYKMPKDIEIRTSNVNTIYTTTDLAQVKLLIDKYNISYIYIGSLEYSTYSNINVNFLTSLGQTVYNNNSTYLIKVK